MNPEIVFFDVETTGFDDPDVIQICIDSDGYSVNELFKPTKNISISAMATHHITEEMVADKTLFSEHVALEYCRSVATNGGVFVAHNAEFDCSVLSRYGVSIDRFICTMYVAKAFFSESQKKPKSYGLQYLRYFIGLKFTNEINPHDAFSDVLVLKGLYNVFSEKYSADEMIEITKTALTPENFEMPYGKHKGMKISEIWAQNPSYLNWAKSNLNGSAHQKIVQFLKERGGF